MKREEELTVSVKPLVWSHRNDQPAYEVCADCPFGRYAISPAGEHGYGWKQPRQNVWSGFLPTCDEAKAAAQADYEARIRSALLPNPKPEPVGWETDAEWDLEMRCCNITEATPFAEVSKLINDLWQQYCLAAEPKPDATEGGAHEKGIEAATIALRRKLALHYSIASETAIEIVAAYRSALTAKQTDGREVE
jgi:hypothetical protein